MDHDIKEERRRSFGDTVRTMTQPTYKRLVVLVSATVLVLVFVSSASLQEIGLL